VAIFSKYEPISIFEDLEEPEYSQEGRVLTLEYELFYLVVVYMPTAGMKKPGQKELERLEYKTQKY
jgi:exodeoxyribonuclease-3